MGDTRMANQVNGWVQVPMRAIEQQVQDRVDRRFAPRSPPLAAARFSRISPTLWRSLPCKVKPFVLRTVTTRAMRSPTPERKRHTTTGKPGDDPRQVSQRYQEEYDPGSPNTHAHSGPKPPFPAPVHLPFIL
jgi:hypothetical protein